MTAAVVNGSSTPSAPSKPRRPNVNSKAKPATAGGSTMGKSTSASSRPMPRKRRRASRSASGRTENQREQQHHDSGQQTEPHGFQHNRTSDSVQGGRPRRPPAAPVQPAAMPETHRAGPPGRSLDRMGVSPASAGWQLAAGHRWRGDASRLPKAAAHYGVTPSAVQADYSISGSDSLVIRSNA